MLRTVDTDVVVLCTALITQTNLTEIWILFGTGKTRRLISAHIIARTLRPQNAYVHANVPCLHWMRPNITLSEEGEENNMEYYQKCLQK